MSASRKVSPLRSIEKAAEFGDQRELLVALRDLLWQAMHDDRTQPRDLSPLTLRLKELQAEIADLDLMAEAETERRRPLDRTFNVEDL